MNKPVDLKKLKMEELSAILKDLPKKNPSKDNLLVYKAVLEEMARRRNEGKTKP